MMSGWSAVFTALIYLCALFALALWGDTRGRHFVKRPRVRAAVYALSICIYCSSWTFFGSVGIASIKGLDFLPIYLGPILAFTLGRRIIARVARLSKAQNIISIADFLGARYGKSPRVAALAALIGLIATVPFLALQLKAMSAALGTVLGSLQAGHVLVAQGTANRLALASACILAAFAMAFGTRRLDATEHQDGLMLAVAAEALIKLVAFVTVGAFVVWGMFHGLWDLKLRAMADSQIRGMLLRVPDLASWTAIALLCAFATITLPRQFHVAIVENRQESDIRTASFVFPAYLVAINLFVVPLAIAGLLTFTDEAIQRDMTVLALPLEAQAGPVVLLGMLGGLSAAAAMAIVAAVAMSIMISNDLIMPWLLRVGATRRGGMRPLILATRRGAIGLLLALAFGYLVVAGDATLDSIGLLSVAAIGQLAPAFFGGLIWVRANGRGALAGMAIGILVWGYTLLLPSLDPARFPVGGLLANGWLEQAWLRPQNLFSLNLSPFVNGALWSLCANLAAYVGFSLTRHLTSIEQVQAQAFCAGVPGPGRGLAGWRDSKIPLQDLEAIVARYVGVAQAREAFAAQVRFRPPGQRLSHMADAGQLQFAEGLLASVIGAASARLVLSLTLQTDRVSPDAAQNLLESAAASIKQNRELLQHALDHARQGITVTDASMRLLFWNREFRDLFQMPAALLRPGVAFADILRCNAERGFYGPGAPETLVARRLDSLQQAQNVVRLRVDPLNMVVEIRSARMPDGGLVTTYSNVTDMVRTEEALEERVRQRTVELEETNRQLGEAKLVAETANLSKTRFLAAASHDILQPLNAARLYASALGERQIAAPEAQLVSNLGASLESVEEILAALLEISRLDAGAQKAELSDFSVQDLFAQLRIEFAPIAAQRSLRLTFVASSAVLRSDRRLLRRLLQNLISNAIKYTVTGGVTIGARRHGDAVRLEIWDTGLGIASAQQARIFEEFQRLDEGARLSPGLGLGLSIVERLRQVLSHEILLRSQPGKGSTFGVVVPLGLHPVPMAASAAATPPATGPLHGLNVTVIDNEPRILEGMVSLLGGWGCVVSACANRAAALAAPSTRPDAVLADFHLDNDTGIAVIGALRAMYGPEFEAVLITADRSAAMLAQAQSQNIRILHKPLKPASLRALLQQAKLRKDAV